VTASNARPVTDRRLSVGGGGLSGRALWSITPTIVASLRREIGDAASIHACGGVFTADDVRACLAAGATTVQVYSALIFEGPGLPGKLTRGLAGGTRGRRSIAPHPAETSNAGG
jgi:dihydroorotate dehydrogenase